MRKFIYEINDFYPPNKSSLGAWGFSISLDQEIAIKLRELKRENRIEDILQEQGRRIVTGFKLNKLGKIKHPFQFVEDSLLLRSALVPGDACDLSLDDVALNSFVGNYKNYRESLDEYIKKGGEMPSIQYISHNVDSQQQASALLSLWAHWANTTKFLVNPIQP